MAQKSPQKNLRQTKPRNNHQRNQPEIRQKTTMSLEVEKSRKDYTAEINRIKQEIPREEGISTPKLAENSHTKEEKEDDEDGYNWKTWRYHIVPGILKHLEKKGEVEKEKRFEGGEATHYWRMKK